MKKLLLSFALLLSFLGVSAQGFQPMDIAILSCQQDNSTFDLDQLNMGAWFDASPSDYQVSYHLSSADAQSGVNPIQDPSNYVVGTTPIVYVRYQRISDNALSFSQIVFETGPAPNVPTTQSFEYCDGDGDGIMYIDLGSIAESLWAQLGAGFEISFHETEMDAQLANMPIDYSSFQNTVPNQQVIWARSSDLQTGCHALTQIFLYINQCDEVCAAPTSFEIYAFDTTAMVHWNAIPGVTYEVYLAPFGQTPTPQTAGIVSTGEHFFSDLDCGMHYQVFVRTFCADGTISNWSAGESILPACPQSGTPENLFKCSFASTACFFLTDNTYTIINTLDQSTHVVTYHVSEPDAMAGTNAIANSSNYCLPTPVMEVPIFARLENTTTGAFEVLPFYLNSSEVVPAEFNFTPLIACDSDNDGSVVFDLTLAGDQIDPNESFTYFTNSQDAATFDNPIANPSNFSVSATSSSTVIFVREFVNEACHRLYQLTLQISTSCVETATCIGANSLCNSLGIPFANTQNNIVSGNGNFGCIGTVANPTWFYLPIGVAGNVNLVVDQNTSSDFNQLALDVDFVAFGPFTDPIAACAGGLTVENIVDCSFSVAVQEIVNIPNAQPGEYYLLMITNYSNMPGYIKITQPTTGETGELDCTGLKLTAFLDSNSNGAKDVDEQNFPLGNFTYETNNDGNIHNISTLSGTYEIYYLSAGISYDFGFALDPLYATNFALTTSSYSNISIVPGGGLQEYFFPVTVAANYADLAVNIIPNEAPRPGFTYSNTISYSNLGTEVISGTVTFGKDPDVSILSVMPAGATLSTNGFSYNFANLLPFETRTINIEMQVPTIPTISLGQLLTSTASIVPVSGDIAPENNSASSSQTVIGSYDPNDKMESHGPEILHADFTATDYLYYTIRFENTGTASAINVNITDMLDSGLDVSSLRMVSASHYYVLDRVDRGLSWSFEHIMLPAASQDSEGAKGYVQYKIKPLPGYAIGDVIQNTAAIYFDFNPPIITNTFVTTFVQQLHVTDSQVVNFKVYPNPANDHVFVASDVNIESVTIYNLLGKAIKTVQGGTANLSIDVSDLSSGLYLLEISDGNIKQLTKLVIN